MFLCNIMEKSKNHEEYKELLSLVRRTGIDVYDFKDEEGIEIRRRCFRNIFHYSALNGPNGKPIPLDEASNEMLCKSFAGHYKRAQKSINQNQGLLFKIYDYK